jgi:hypothetical protein
MHVRIITQWSLKGFFRKRDHFKKKLDKHLENSIKHKTEAMTMLNTQGNGAYPKLSTNMTYPPWKLYLEMLFLTKLSLKTWKEVWQPRGTPEGRRRCQEWEKGQPIYRENLLPTPCRTCGCPATLAYVRWFLHIGPEGVSYV